VRTGIRPLAVVLVWSLALNACAFRAPALQAVPPPNGARQGSWTHSDEYVRYIKSLPPGTPVRVAMRDGERLSAIFLGAEGDQIVLKPRTRIPEPERRVPIDRIAAIEVDERSGGISTGRAVLIGVLSGAATFFGLLLILAAAAFD
jgi:hypothetical protein